MEIGALFLVLTYASAYSPMEKENNLPSILLDELTSRMRKESEASYLDIGSPNFLEARSLEQEQYDPLDYELGDALYHPSIRDQEYLKHSSLFGSMYAKDDSAEVNQHSDSLNQTPLSNEVKTKNNLPAYCNPPNPCPVGYEDQEGCLEIFSNTATFSRRYQEEQDCMCDSEHMFDCPDNAAPILDNSIHSLRDYQIDRYLQKQIEANFPNPFLSGERLPIAAKKGNLVL
ncbi:hypothetical protein WA026_012414 [Henosepilachna vigintioctopunctata]|uniref:Neuroendocrine protein 7B2 n=1 Tax=Henosepilachna vigintioctopunctata TaxID=420089 RepID=A0AAW1V0C2_9CUCU